MVKIEILTTLRNQQHLDGLANSGDEVYVPESYARELVEEKDFAKYVQDSFEIVETSQGEYPKGFLDEKIPDNFPSENLHDKLKENGIHTFGALLSHEDFGDLSGIGPTYSEEIEKGISVAVKDWKDKNE